MSRKAKPPKAPQPGRVLKALAALEKAIRAEVGYATEMEVLLPSTVYFYLFETHHDIRFGDAGTFIYLHPRRRPTWWGEFKAWWRGA